MRLSLSVVATLAALLLPSVAATRFPRFKVRDSIKKPSNGILERHLRTKRSDTDDCVAIRSDVFAEDIDTWLAADEDGIKLSDRVGTDATKESLEFMLDTPCDPNFTEQDDGICVCLRPFLECDGGGCVTPHPFYEPHRVTSKGVDCGRIPGVVSASCEQSQCVVSLCKTGLVPNDDKTKCVPSASLSQGILVSLPIFHSKRQTDDTTDPPSITDPVSANTIKAEISALAAAIVKLQIEAINILPAPVLSGEKMALLTLPGDVQVPVDADITTPIVLAVTELLTATEESAVLDAIHNLAAANAALSTALGPLSTSTISSLPDLAGLLELLDSVGQLSLEIQSALTASVPELDLPLGLDDVLETLVWGEGIKPA
ncbi:hypothetical protein C0991_007755 [Blastosporella zonata]|nr:hypothetical protein C0991_007755 [Blastosporella zonata]